MQFRKKNPWLSSSLFKLNNFLNLSSSVHFSSITQSRLTLCDPMNCSASGFPVHHQLPEFTQTHVHWVGDAIQPFHPLLSPYPPTFNPSQHQGLFQWVSFSYHVAKVLEFQLNISPSNEHLGLISFRMDWLDLLAVQRTLSLLKTTVQKHQFFGTQERVKHKCKVMKKQS